METMENMVAAAILEALSIRFGKDSVDAVDGKIYVTNEDFGGTCEISIRYEE